MSLRSQTSDTDAYSFDADPVLRSPVRVMRVWSKDQSRSVVVVNTKDVFNAAYAGWLMIHSGPDVLADDKTLSEIDALSWIAAERAVAKAQADAMKAERSASILANIRAQRPAVQTARAA